MLEDDISGRKRGAPVDFDGESQFIPNNADTDGIMLCGNLVGMTHEYFAK
jgi:hypothetical protein